jgi:hypothetical protein
MAEFKFKILPFDKLGVKNKYWLASIEEASLEKLAKLK